MPKDKLPRLTEAQVRKLATPQSFERGQKYFRNEAIIEPVIQGMELRAQCEGSEDEPYQVSATLGKGGVAETSCDCPYDYGGVCKHIVALLLTYVHEPQHFRALSSLKITLNEFSKEELIELIGGMVKAQPKLMAQIELLSAAPKSGRPLNVATYRSQARSALRSESPRTIEKNLKALRDVAAKLAKAGDWLNAGAIYHVAFDEAVHGYDDMVQAMDENGDICTVMDELATGLSNCLKNSLADSQTRRDWLETMLEAELRDTELGGIDLAPSAGEAVLKQSTAEEWAWLEKRLRTEIIRSHGWARESLVRLLTEGQQQHGGKARAAETIRDLGTMEQRTMLLIEEKKIAEALKHIAMLIVGKPGLVTEFADAMVKAGAKAEALKLVLEQGSDHWMNQNWLARYYKKHGTLQEAIETQLQIFARAPSVELFKTLQKLCRKTGDWEAVRERALNAAEKQQQFGPLIRIALDEKDLHRALELLPQVADESQIYSAEVARAAEKNFPEAALIIYQDMAERAINGRNRLWYQRAVEYLKKVKKLHERSGRKNEFAPYVQALKTKYAKLSSLQEELKTAQL